MGAKPWETRGSTRCSATSEKINQPGRLIPGTLRSIYSGWHSLAETIFLNSLLPERANPPRGGDAKPWIQSFLPRGHLDCLVSEGRRTSTLADRNPSGIVIDETRSSVHRDATHLPEVVKGHSTKMSRQARTLLGRDCKSDRRCATMSPPPSTQGCPSLLL